VSLTNDSPDGDDQANASGPSAPINSFTLLDLYERARKSGNSLSTELRRYFNIDGVTSSSPSNESDQSNYSVDIATVHERALAAILDVVISNANSSFECIRVPEPPGGVQEWWARMLSGSMNDTHSAVRAQL
jgi:hypothetical protein